MPTKESNTIPVEPWSLLDKRLLLTLSGEPTNINEEMIIPNLLSYPGSVVVTDPFGEYFKKTAAYRKANGQQIIKIDPFGVVDDRTDAFNPFDSLQFSGDNLINDVNAFVSEWHEDVHHLLTGVILYLFTKERNDCNLNSIYKFLLSENLFDSLAKIVKEKSGEANPLALEYFNHFLHKSDSERDNILCQFQDHFWRLSTPLMRRAMCETSFDIANVVAGHKLSIYLLLPPVRQRTVKIWQRLTLNSLARVMAGASVLPLPLIIIDKVIPDKRYLFKQFQQTGKCKVWAFLLPTDILDLCDSSELFSLLATGVLQLVGSQSPLIIRQLAEIFGMPVGDIQTALKHHFLNLVNLKHVSESDTLNLL